MLIAHFIFSEALRKYPSISMLPRACTKNYIIPGTDILIEKDTFLMIPIHAIQNDPVYFPDPQTFNPERFNDEQSGNENLLFSFGEGPRQCIGKTKIRTYENVQIKTR
jgi:cytochrome P450 family 6